MSDIREYIRRSIEKNAIGIEIGASWFPIVPKKEGYKTYVVDHCSARELRQICENDPMIKTLVENIEEVDFIDDGSDFRESLACPDGFDFIVSAHNIEHIPNPVGFLLRAQRALKPGGRLYMIVPNRRNTFDYYRPVSTVGQLLEAYREQRVVHSFSAVYDARTYHVSGNTPDGAITLNRKQDKSLYHEILANVNSGEYVDAHGWVFTPSNFQHLIFSLNNIGIISHRLVKLTTTSHDFLVVLEPMPTPTRHGNDVMEELLQKVLEEAVPNPRRIKTRPYSADKHQEKLYEKTEISFKTRKFAYAHGDITNYCNASCKFCNRNSWVEPDKYTNMTEEIFQKYLQILPFVEQGCLLSCSFEPTLHPRLSTLINLLTAECRNKFFLTTNLAKKMSDSDIEVLANAKIHHINISFNTLRHDIYKTIMGINNVCFFSNLDRLHKKIMDGRTSNAPELQFITLCLKDNYSELHDIAKIAGEHYGATYHDFRLPFRFASQNNDTKSYLDDQTLSKSEVDKLRDELHALPYNISVTIPDEYIYRDT